MKNKVLLVFLALVLVVSLVVFAACKAEEEPPVVEEEEPPVVEEEEPPVVEEVWDWPEVTKVLAVSSAGQGYAALLGWGSLLERDTGMKLRIVPEASFPLRARWVKDGSFLFVAFSPDADLPEIMRASKGHATRSGGPFQARVLWMASKMGYGYVLRGDSDIRTVDDIKPGVRVGWMAFAGQFGHDIIQALLDWAQVAEEDAEWVPISNPGDIMRVITEGRADIVQHFTTSVGPIEAEAGPHGLHWIPLDPKTDPEGAARYWRLRPLVSFAVNMEGVASSIGVPMMAGYAVDFTRAETDPELVYHLVKWLHENYDEYKDAHIWCKHMDIDSVMEILETTYIPAHDGLVTYLKEIGRWTTAHDARQKENIDLMTSYCEAWEDAIDEADKKGINVDPENEEWVDLWHTYLDKLPPLTMYPGLD